MEKRDKLLESDFLENGPPMCCELLRILFTENEEPAGSVADLRPHDLCPGDADAIPAGEGG
jgi:hypothetical protein